MTEDQTPEILALRAQQHSDRAAYFHGEAERYSRMAIWHARRARLYATAAMLSSLIAVGFAVYAILD